MLKPELDRRYENAQNTFSAYFGTSKSTLMYKQQIEESMSRYDKFTIPNLGAIVLPGCHGKSKLAKRYGFIDVDDLLGPEDHNRLTEMRLTSIEKKDMSWKEHNNIWWDKIRGTLKMMKFDVPTIILVHTEETAREIGAHYLFAATLSDSEFERNIQRSGRGKPGRIFSRMSRTEVLHKTTEALYTNMTNQRIEALVLNTCNSIGVPVGAPAKFSYSYLNQHYDYTVPEWVLEGRTKEMDIDVLIHLQKEGRVPPECVDYFVRNGTTTASVVGYGVTKKEWAELIGLVMSAIDRPTKISDDCDLRELFPHGSLKEANRVNVTLRRLEVSFGVMGDQACRTIMEHHVGERNVFVSGLLLYWMGLGRHSKFKELLYMIMLIPEDRYRDITKKFHNLVRVSGRLVDEKISEEERHKMMYLELLFGKFVYEMEEARVLEGRIRPTMYPDKVSFESETNEWTVRQYRKDFVEALSKGSSYMVEKVPKRYKYQDLSDFWKHRKKWCTKGSIVGNKIDPEEKHYVVEYVDAMNRVAVRRLHNKMSLVEMHNLQDFFKETEEEFNTSKVAYKFEAAKERALLPGNLCHFILFTYVLEVAEGYGQFGTTRLNSPGEENPEYYLTKLMDTGVHLLYDWADFNAQHSTWEMKTVLESLERVVVGGDDYNLFVQVIANSMMNMTIDFNNKKTRVNQGLYSGWRGTTWINTALNYVYIEVARMNYCRIYNHEPIGLIDHGGDDVDASTGSARVALQFMAIMEKIGNDANPIKQMIDFKSEFFRITAAEGRLYGSPVRAMAQFVSGNWEGAGPGSVSERLQGVLDSVSKMKRRGVSDVTCKSLIGMSVLHWCRIKSDDNWVSMSRQFVHGRIEDGGLGVPDDDNRVWILREKVPKVSGLSEMVKLPGVNASSDYVELLDKELNTYGLSLRNKSEFVRKVAMDSFDLQKEEGIEEWKAACNFETEVLDKVDVVVEKKSQYEYKEFGHWVDMKLAEELEWNEEMVNILDRIEGRGGEDFTYEEKMELMTGKRLRREIVEFTGDRYYAWLVPDFLANNAKRYCQWLMWEYSVSVEYAQEAFRTICWFAMKEMRHMM